MFDDQPAMAWVKISHHEKDERAGTHWRIDLDPLRQHTKDNTMGLVSPGLS